MNHLFNNLIGLFVALGAFGGALYTGLRAAGESIRPRFLRKLKINL